MHWKQIVLSNYRAACTDTRPNWLYGTAKPEAKLQQNLTNRNVRTMHAVWTQQISPIGSQRLTVSFSHSRRQYAVWPARAEDITLYHFGRKSKYGPSTWSASAYKIPSCVQIAQPARIPAPWQGHWWQCKLKVWGCDIPHDSSKRLFIVLSWSSGKRKAFKSFDLKIKIFSSSGSLGKTSTLPINDWQRSA